MVISNTRIVNPQKDNGINESLNVPTFLKYWYNVTPDVTIIPKTPSGIKPIKYQFFIRGIIVKGINKAKNAKQARQYPYSCE